MDNFNLQGYIASGKLYANSKTLTEAKKQGYDDREDESLGARKGAEKGKKQSMKARRDDSYGKFGKRDAEKKGKNKINKEGVIKEDMSIEDVYNDAQKQVKDIYDIDVPMNVVKQWADNYQFPYSREVDPEDEDQYILVYDFGTEERGDFMEWLKDNNLREGLLDFLKKKKEAAPVRKEDPNPIIGVDYDGNYIRKDGTMAEGAVTEDARTDAEEEGYKDGMKDEKADMKKMKVSELKAKIKEEILAELTLSEADEEVDVDIDVEDEVEVDAEADDIEIERKGTTAKVEVGLSPEEEIVQDSLKAAMDAAQALGSDKLADQIGNTITFFTRQFVVGDRTD